MRLVIIMLITLLSACSTTSRKGGYYEDDGPHAAPHVDLTKIADAKPRREPRARSGNKPYSVFGVQYVPLKTARGYQERGVASWYGKKFHGKRTSSGESYDMYAMTAAHKTLPLPSYVRVRNLRNGRSVIVRVNDRGPFLHNRLIDLSYAAAGKLGVIGTGTGIVEVSAIDPDQHQPPAQTEPQPPATVTDNTASDRPSSEGTLFVQVGAFGERENAQRLQKRLNDRGIDNIVIHDEVIKARHIYRVRIGPLDNVEAVDKITLDMHEQGIKDAHVVVQ